MSTYTLDISSEHCPMTFVKTKLKLETLSIGDCLTVILREGEPLDNLPKTCREQGYGVSEAVDLGNGLYEIQITKPA